MDRVSWAASKVMTKYNNFIVLQQDIEKTLARERELALDSDECQFIDFRPNFVIDNQTLKSYISSRNR